MLPVPLNWYVSERKSYYYSRTSYLYPPLCFIYLVLMSIWNIFFSWKTQPIGEELGFILYYLFHFMWALHRLFQSICLWPQSFPQEDIQFSSVELKDADFGAEAFLLTPPCLFRFIDNSFSSIFYLTTCLSLGGPGIVLDHPSPNILSEVEPGEVSDTIVPLWQWSQTLIWTECWIDKWGDASGTNLSKASPCWKLVDLMVAKSEVYTK